MASQGQTVSSPFEYSGVEWNFLDLQEMRNYPVESSERKCKIIGRLNYFLFDNHLIRGHEFEDNKKWIHLLNTFEEKHIKTEYGRPNPELEILPEWFLAKFHSPTQKWTLEWVIAQKMSDDKIVKETIENGLNIWETEGRTRAQKLRKAIDRLPQPQRIKKVVCIGLGAICTCIAVPKNPETQGNTQAWEPCINKGVISHPALAQHVTALVIVNQLQQKTGQIIDLYTGDPMYGEPHKKALESLNGTKFRVLRTDYGKHEHFTMIDDSTFLIAICPGCEAISLVSEYARPVAMLCESLSRHQDPSDFDKVDPDILWYELEDPGTGTKIKIPGTTDYCIESKRLCDMLDNEYTIEEEFPHEERFPLDENELDDDPCLAPHAIPPPGQREPDKMCWNAGVRMYVRKDK
ncbi:hypothetical protein F5B20DRAFT_593676 [Whalleya microplaca]|nr:hypothetical protein F5B20DRAFT_593676 [Whalleya microplaca]